MFNRLLQNGMSCRAECVSTEAPSGNRSGFLRIDSREKQNFRSVEISDTCNHSLIKQGDLNLAPTCFQLIPQFIVMRSQPGHQVPQLAVNL